MQNYLAICVWVLGITSALLFNLVIFYDSPNRQIFPLYSNRGLGLSVHQYHGNRVEKVDTCCLGGNARQSFVHCGDDVRLTDQSVHAGVRATTRH